MFANLPKLPIDFIILQKFHSSSRLSKKVDFESQAYRRKKNNQQDVLLWCCSIQLTQFLHLSWMEQHHYLWYITCVMDGFCTQYVYQHPLQEYQPNFSLRHSRRDRLHRLAWDWPKGCRWHRPAMTCSLGLKDRSDDFKKIQMFCSLL